MTFNRMTCAVLFSLAVSCLLLPQASNDLAQKVESRAEVGNDYALVTARIQNNQREYQVLRAFCSVALAEPARTARTTYCTSKAAEFNSKDADLKAQAQKLALNAQQLDAQIRDLQKPKPQTP